MTAGAKRGERMRRSRWTILLSFTAVALLAPPAAAAADRHYDLVHQWQLPEAQALATGLDGNVYAVESRTVPGTEGATREFFGRVHKFDPDGAPLTEWGEPGSGPGRFGYVTDIAAGPDGSVYVADAGNAVIQKFDPDGGFLGSWGEQGAAPGQFGGQIWLATGPDGSVYVSDQGNGRMQRFDADGGFISAWDGAGPGQNALDHPRGLAIDAAGDAYVVDDRQVRQFDGAGNPIGEVGRYGGGEGRLQLPRDVAVAASGDIYVSDVDTVEVFAADGESIGSWRSDYADSIATSPGPDGNAFVYVTGPYGTDGANGILKYGEVPFETTLTARPPDLTGESRPVFRFTAEGSAATFECSLDQAPFARCDSPFVSPQLADGRHDFRVRGLEADGDYVDRTPAGAELWIDTVVDAEIGIEETQRVQRRGIELTVDGGREEVIWPRAGVYFEALGKIKIGGRRGTTFALPRRGARVADLLSGISGSLWLAPERAKRARREMLSALRRGRKVRARIRAKVTDSAGNVKRMHGVVRLERNNARRGGRER